MPDFATSELDFAMPPYRLTKVTSICLPVEGDQKRLQKICDDFLSGPLGVPGRFKATSSTVSVSFSDFPDVSCAKPPPSGFVSYQEVALMFAVLDTVANRLYKFMPVLFLDGPDADRFDFYSVSPIIAGRELLGLPKVAGEISLDLDRLSGNCQSLQSTSAHAALPLAGRIQIDPMDPAWERDRRSAGALGDADAEPLVATRGGSAEGTTAGPVPEPPSFTRLDLLRRRWAPDDLIGLGIGLGLDQERLKEVFLPRAAATPEGDSTFLDSSDGQKLTAGVCNGEYDCMSWIGLRQFRQADTGKFSNTAFRSVVTSTFVLDRQRRYAGPAAYNYSVTFAPSALATRLGLKDSYEVNADMILIYRGAAATYGDLVETLT